MGQNNQQNTQVQNVGDKWNKIVEKSTDKIANLVRTGKLTVPPNYAVMNEVDLAWAQMCQPRPQDKDKRPLLEKCDAITCRNAIIEMAARGLSLIKDQCYLIPYGTTCTLSVSKWGWLALAKRHAGVVEWLANCVFEGDEFDFGLEDFRTKIITHEQGKRTRDAEKIEWAYCILRKADGNELHVVRDIGQIEDAWDMSPQAKVDQGQYTPFQRKNKIDAVERTVIKRACKQLVKVSNDSALLVDQDVFQQLQAEAMRDRTQNNQKEAAENSEYIDATAANADEESSPRKQLSDGDTPDNSTGEGPQPEPDEQPPAREEPQEQEASGDRPEF